MGVWYNSALEALATERGLEMVHVIDLDRFAEGSAGVLSPEVKWVGSSNCPGPIAAAAAVLTRLAVRIDQRREEKGGGAAALREAVVLCPAAEHPGFVAEVLALLLRNHWGVDPGRAEVGAVADALRALGSDAIQGAEPGTSQAGRGCGRPARLPGGLRAARDDRVAWRLQLLGAAPGRHRYKFIVDGRWCADLRAPLEHDVWHNANNLLDVPPAPKGPALSAERQAALGAACLAFYTKPL
ncbi:hypothetical protein QBZ16_002281 [Prototheca wickerhamii]|uniref:AMP-activated protein kinase glycogen-binding domain-containing protein n=1 Tax=Prototheca wickerhamii TaxID=3111 RepID=A0AAD9ILK7_PROWI|nr:hypothetical protein QBZ16_002281 [Prototheca wickerhamii]